jgi:hypothetical protein
VTTRPVIVHDCYIIKNILLCNLAVCCGAGKFDNISLNLLNDTVPTLRLRTTITIIIVSSAQSVRGRLDMYDPHRKFWTSDSAGLKMSYAELQNVGLCTTLLEYP